MNGASPAGFGHMMRQRTQAAFVHIYTATGGAFAFCALVAIAKQRFHLAFLFLLIAFAVDGSDGTLARAMRVKEVLPEFDGENLDLVIDFLTYALVPLFLLWMSEVLPEPRWLWAGLILAASLYDYCKVHTRMGEGYYTGLPCFWNFYAFYAFYLRPSPLVQALTITLLVLLTFAPIHFLYVSRFERYRKAHFVLLGLWLLIVGLVSQGLVQQVRLWLLVSLAYPLFYVLCSVIVQLREQGSSRRSSLR